MKNTNESNDNVKKGGLALYKQTPALVGAVGEKIELLFPDGNTKKVRPKDIRILHQGPVDSIKNVTEAEIELDLDEAWELLQGETANLAEFTELVAGEASPRNVWAVFRAIRMSDCFTGDIDEITPVSAEEIQAKRERKAEREKTENEWREHLERLKTGSWDERDLQHLKELERYACGLSSSNRSLKELKMPSTPEKAHELLLRLGVWSDYVNPHPVRAGQPLSDPEIPVPAATDEKRLDLTHLASFAIDDDGCQDPDDAVSVDGDAIWIHVADPAAVALPDSLIDLEARDRGSNAYLPEKMVKMLPDEMTSVFGLGLSDTSPALSFKIVIAADGVPTCEQVELSIIAAKMVSYEEAERRISEEPFSALAKFAAANRERREADGAFSLSLPEVKVTARFNDGRTPLEHDLVVGGRMEAPERMEISPYPELESREMIAELMVMAGEAVGKFLREHDIPAPFAGQAPPENPIGDTDSLSAMFACRRQLRRTQLHTSPARHAGLGLDTYTRVTSPLRRYSDLLVHQQLRAFLKGESLISEENILERMSQGETGAFRATISERRSSQHWKLVNLKERGKPSVSATIVEVMDNRCKLLIPELAIDAALRNPGEVGLDQEIELKLAGVDIPELDVRWRK